MDLPPPEFSRPIGLHQIGDGSRAHALTANEAERAALARRFSLLALDRLEANVTLRPEAAGWRAEGRLVADLAQACVATGEAVPEHVEADFSLRFVRELDGLPGTPDAEIDLTEEALDDLPVEGERIDLGEAVAQTLALNLTPFPRSAGADDALRAAGVLSEDEAGPFAALASLKEKLGRGGAP